VAAASSSGSRDKREKPRRDSANRGLGTDRSLRAANVCCAAGDPHGNPTEADNHNITDSELERHGQSMALDCEPVLTERHAEVPPSHKQMEVNHVQDPCHS